MGKAEIEPRNLAEEEEQLRRRIRHGEDTEDECFGGVEPQPASAVCLILHLLVVVKVKMMDMTDRMESMAATGPWR